MGYTFKVCAATINRPRLVLSVGLNDLEEHVAICCASDVRRLLKGILERRPLAYNDRLVSARSASESNN